ncbi:MAG: hypothetical protein WCK02_11860 [Bacteroidota bacterium]
MKKNIFILFAILIAGVFVAKAQNNNQVQKHLYKQYQSIENKGGDKQNLTLAYAGEEKSHEIQSLTYTQSRGSKTGLKVGGIIVAAVGIGMLIGGISMINNANGETYYNATSVNGQTTEEGSLGGAVGSLLAVGGGVFTLGGAAMVIIGFSGGKRHH